MPERGSVRHGDLIHHAVDGDFHPLRAAERLMRGDNPCAGFIGRGEQAGIADFHCRDLAGQSEGGQDFGHGGGRVAGEDVFKAVAGKFYCIGGKAILLRGNRRGKLKFLAIRPYE